jgi:hypothetical protein
VIFSLIVYNLLYLFVAYLMMLSYRQDGIRVKDGTEYEFSETEGG